MFKRKISKFGVLDKYTYSHEGYQVHLEIVPELGGCMTHLQFAAAPYSIIDGYDSYEAFEIEKGQNRNHFLLPFPNRLKGGKYTFNKKNYQFPINQPELNNNLHGFLTPLPMEVISEGFSKESAFFTLQAIYNQQEPFFPFHFKWRIQFFLTKETLTIKTIFINQGEEAMPIGWGWHPYFKLESKTINDLELKLPKSKQVILNENIIPTGEKVDFNKFQTFEPIKEQSYDDCFEIIQNTSTQKVECSIRSKTTQLQLWQSVGERKCPFFQVFTPEHRRTIALEPMTCNIDAFNNGEGLITLAPKERLDFDCGVVLTSVQ